VLTAYKAFSGYGQRAGRALAWLLLPRVPVGQTDVNASGRRNPRPTEFAVNRSASPRSWSGSDLVGGGFAAESGERQHPRPLGSP
jgi:hypothetical protein